MAFSKERKQDIPRLVLGILIGMLLGRFLFGCSTSTAVQGTLFETDLQGQQYHQTQQPKRVIYQKGSCKVKMVGGNPNNNNYGEWPVCTNLLPKNPLVYSFGIGSDVTFDVAMVQDYDAQAVFCYDPTISQETFGRITEGKPHRQRLFFSQLGLGASDSVIHFYKSEDPRIGSLVSTPGLKGYKPDPFLTAPVHQISSIAAINKHAWVDVIKLDAEGAEFDVFLEIDIRSLPTSQVLIEFHARLYDGGWDKQAYIYKRFEEAGWELAYEQPEKKEECIFIRVS